MLDEEKQELTQEVEQEVTQEQVETKSQVETENVLDNFDDNDVEEMDLTTEKVKELNKKLPSWSLEPPASFLK